jgi:cytochrome c-type biogenesis protein CcmH
MTGFSIAGRAVLAALFALLLAGAAHAVEPSEMLKDPALEARARAISQDIRCVVCQNQTIDDSNADIAHDLRVIVRERLQDGDTDQQVRDYLTARYGDYLLLNPPFRAKTLILWLGPAVFLLIGVGVIVAAARKRRAIAPAPLNEEESRRLARLAKPE